MAAAPLSAIGEEHTRDADEVERHPCPRCAVATGSPCRSRSGAVAGTYRTGWFTKVPRLAKLLRVITPADRNPGRPRRPGTPPPAPLRDDRPTADIRFAVSLLLAGQPLMTVDSADLAGGLSGRTKHPLLSRALGPATGRDLLKP
ncbi:zinc finger domain-containing protein [Streptosporangium saharense]|uniref:zinc finger domain-containing protein n=1 Tax=Streptosporangium saharense TaxID=1706840 RepID=UPI003F4E1300